MKKQGVFALIIVLAGTMSACAYAGETAEVSEVTEARSEASTTASPSAERAELTEFIYPENPLETESMLSLDFDGTPEVLVSKTVIDDENEYEREYADVDMYYIDGEKLVYIDTLYNYFRLNDSCGNVPGLKTEDNGRKNRVYISRKNLYTGQTSDDEIIYVFTVKDGKAKYAEALRRNARERK